MNCLTHTKRMGAVSLLCSFLIGMAPGLITSGSGGIAGEITEIFGLSGSWDASSCYAQNGRMDNCLAISDICIPDSTPFTYEADVHISDGLAASLVFGTDSDGNGLSTACVDRGSRLAHVFAGTAPSTTLLPTARSHSFRIT